MEKTKNTTTTKIIMNETRKKVIEALKNATEPLTLKEISALIGVEVKSGSTNPLISAGILRVVNTKKEPVISYREVNTYELGDLSILEK